MRDADSRRVTYDRGEVIGSIRQKQSAERHYGAWVKGRQEQLRGGGKAGISVQVPATTGLKSVESKTAKSKNLQKANKNVQK